MVDYKIEDDGHLTIQKETPLNYEEAYEILKDYYSKFPEFKWEPTDEEVYCLVDRSIDNYFTGGKEC